jgi:drug/metabolite transporter (DMT)-like permease
LREKSVTYGTFAAVFVATAWGISFVAASHVLETISPVLLATLRFIIASILFTPVMIAGILSNNVPRRKELQEMAYLGILSISIYFWLQYTGIKYAGLEVSAILVVGFIPVLTGLISNILMGEPFEKWRILGVCTGFAGVGLITLPGLILSHVETKFFFGVLCLLGNAVVFSLYSTLSRRLLKRFDKPMVMTSYVTFFGTMALIPVSLTSDWSLIGSISVSQWVSIFFLASICSGLAYFLWNYALSRIESVEAAVWLYLEPVVAFLGVYVLYGSVPETHTVIGGILVLTGAALTSVQR